MFRHRIRGLLVSLALTAAFLAAPKPMAHLMMQAIKPIEREVSSQIQHVFDPVLHRLRDRRVKQQSDRP